MSSIGLSSGGRDTLDTYCMRHRITDIGGVVTHSGTKAGPVDELLDVAVERPALDQLEVEVGRILEDRLCPV